MKKIKQFDNPAIEVGIKSIAIAIEEMYGKKVKNKIMKNALLIFDEEWKKTFELWKELNK